MERAIPFFVLLLLVLPFAIFITLSSLNKTSWLVILIAAFVAFVTLLLLGVNGRGALFRWILGDHDPVVFALGILTAGSLGAFLARIFARRRLLSLQWEEGLDLKAFESRCFDYLELNGWKITNMRRVLGVRIFRCETKTQAFSGILFFSSILFSRFCEALWKSGASIGGNYVFIMPSNVTKAFTEAGIDQKVKVVSYRDLHFIGEIATMKLSDFQERFAIDEDRLLVDIYTSN